jgi:hypothetical protein
MTADVVLQAKYQSFCNELCTNYYMWEVSTVILS